MRRKNSKINYKKFIKETYDKYAEKYDSIESTPELLEFDKELLSLISPLKGKKVLDVGCGSGIFSMLMARAGANVIGVDISQKLLEIAGNRCNNLKRCKFANNDIELFLRKTNKKFNIILSMFSIMYFEDLNKIFKNFHNLMEKKGQLLISFPHPVRNMGMHEPIDYFCKGCFKEKWVIGKIDKKYYFTFQDYINYLIDAGFEIKKIIEPNPPKNKTIMYDKEIKYHEGTKYPQAMIILCEKK